MNYNNRKGSSPTKKRKASDGRAATDCAHDVNTRNTNAGGGFLSSWFGYFSGRNDDATSGSPRYENSIHQSLSQINTTMMRMEEKMMRVESRCEQLERKCSSLETMLESTLKGTKEHVDRKCESLATRLETIVDAVHKQEDKALKHHEYNEMMLKNQSWEYSVPVLSADDFIHNGYSEDDAEYLTETAEELKALTTKMRRGEFTFEYSFNNLLVNDYNDKRGISLEMNEFYPPFSHDVNNVLYPHWKEFAAAIKQFTPAINLLPDICESSLTFDYLQLNNDAMLLVRDALIGKPFKKLAFTNNGNEDGARGGMSVDAILEIVDSNKNLRRLEIFRHDIGSQHIERLCSAVHNHHIVQLDLFGCFEPGIGDKLLASLLTIDDLMLEELYMSSNNITSAVSNLLADFLATNPRLKKLELCGNNLNDSASEFIANALHSNRTLKFLNLDENSITKIGFDCFRRVLWDESSLNAASDSNHYCEVYAGSHLDSECNRYPQMQVRGRKIYHLLLLRNKTMSNVQHFSDIDAKILPNILQAVQKYSKDMRQYDPEVNPLSVVYEVMRRWDKVTPLYKSLGKSVGYNDIG